VPPKAVVKLVAISMGHNGRLQNEGHDLLVVNAVTVVPTHVVLENVIGVVAGVAYQVLLPVEAELFPRTLNPLYPGEWLFFALHVAK
jgi:hypothetical protein